MSEKLFTGSSPVVEDLSRPDPSPPELYSRLAGILDQPDVPLALSALKEHCMKINDNDQRRDASSDSDSYPLPSAMTIFGVIIFGIALGAGLCAAFLLSIAGGY